MKEYIIKTWKGTNLTLTAQQYSYLVACGIRVRTDTEFNQVHSHRGTYQVPSYTRIELVTVNEDQESQLLLLLGDKVYLESKVHINSAYARFDL